MDRLSNTIRPYAWGSTRLLPQLLGTEPTGEPQAEMWMGAHPGAPSRLVRDGGTDGRESSVRTLTEVIAADPVRELGRATVDAFGPQLPFLLKIIAAGAPLSLQVHPNLEQAREGYAREERAAVPIEAAHRNYKDANHKPELVCALTPFEGLCGFRHPEEAADLFSALDVDSLKPYVDVLRAHPEEAALREVLTAVLGADRAETAVTVTEAAAACERAGGRYVPFASLARHYPGDPGVLAAMLLNPLRLQPGEGLFLGAGVPHAYLSGLAVELMANSDNVLRCGLTPKHVDVPELLRVVRFEPSDPSVLRPEGNGEEVYETPTEEFRLSRFVLPPGASAHALPAATAQILLCTAGSPVLRGPDGAPLTLAPGESVFVAAGEEVELSGVGTIFRAAAVV
ncbi:mannose-6-phosphate isomerase, class I [Streptomyces sp. NPDC006879]|uniref:mannose-6-phosphate isomerase, class I n=1 Tax=Streptomyces sp. NPDC006879 TaxID=3364767 RepID=UPI0036CFDA1B